MNAPAFVHHQFTEPAGEPPGTLLAQLMTAHARAAGDRRRNVADIAAEMFGTDQRVLAVARAAATVADTATSTWAQELVRSDSLALLQNLTQLSVFARLAAIGTQLRFDGTKAVRTVGVPLVDPALEPAWVGEAGVIPVVKGVLTGTPITRYKLAGIIPISKELAEGSNAVETMRGLLRQATASLLDRSLLDDAAAVAGVRPAGLRFGVTPLTASSAGGTAAMAEDLAALHGAFQAAAGVGGDVVLIMNTGTRAALGALTNGTFGGQQVIASPLVPADTVIAVDALYFAAAFDPIEFDVRSGVTLTMADAGAAAPTQAMTDAGALGTAHQVLPDRGIHVAGGVSGAANAGFQAISLWQVGAIGVRAVLPAGYAMALDGAVQVLEGITWTQAPA